MYLAVVMDLYSRRIVGWHIDKRMTTDLVNKALREAYSLRNPPPVLVFRSDCGDQYTNRRYLSYWSITTCAQVEKCWCMLG